MPAKPLTANVQLYTAAMDARPVLAYQDDELLGGGIIEDISEMSVKISGDRYMRESCVFLRSIS